MCILDRMFIRGKIRSVVAREKATFPIAANFTPWQKMKLLVKALSLALITLPLLATAGTKSASMQVTFTVVDACTVQADATKAPAVACQLNAPHLVTKQAPAAATSTDAAAVRPAAGAQDWTVYF